MNNIHHLLKSKQSKHYNVCIVLLRYVNILNIGFWYKRCYCLIMLILHWKTLVNDFWQRLVLYRKPCLLFKKWTFSGDPTKVRRTIFHWNFVHMLCVALPRNLWVDFVLLLFCFLKIYRNTIYLALLVGIVKENTWAKFQKKTIDFS